MKPERYQQIEALYHAALERRPEERSAFLKQACVGDIALRDEVESLLGYDQQAEQFIERPLDDIAAALVGDPPPAMVGRILGSYRIISLLGVGGMGEVFLAEDLRLGRQVAIKILSQNFINDEKLIRRFKQEARAVSALNHPNILTLFDIGEDHSTFFIATELVKGQTLRQRLAGGRLPLQDALDIATQIANALAAAHQAGIIHRDIKPENIMLRDDGYVKVLDFGLAKLAEPKTLGPNSSLPTSPMLSTEPGLVMGTTQYMSPEQVRGLTVDQRTDIFSFGVVLYEMLAGVNPFAGATVSDVIAAILEREPQPLTGISPETQHLVSKALRKDLERRYQSVQALLDDLKGAINLQRTAPEQPVGLPMAHFAPPKIHATQETFVMETQKALAVNSAQLPAQQMRLQPTLDNLLKITKIFFPVASFLILIFIALFHPSSPLKINFFPGDYIKRIIYPREESKPDTPVTIKTDTARQKPYLQMTEEEQLEFIRQQSERISGMLGERKTKTPLSDNAIRAIKKYVDGYAARSDNLSQEQWKEGLKMVFGRAYQYAPILVREFKKQNVPPVMGLYVPMIESEYRDCLEGPYGNKGMFQFIPASAKAYGVEPKDMCNVEIMAPAAAKYLADRISEFGYDASSMELVILSFNMSPTGVMRNLRQLRAQDPNLERSFWTLFDHADQFDQVFKDETKWYVPKFFAAAIVGENPRYFDLGIKPLSEQ